MWSSLAVAISMYENTHCLMRADTKAAEESMQLLVRKFLAEIIAYLQNHWSVSAQIENEMWVWSGCSSPVHAAQNCSTSKTHHSPSDPSRPLSYMRFSLPCQNAATRRTFSTLCYDFNQHRCKRTSVSSKRNKNELVLQEEHVCFLFICIFFT